MTKVTSAEHINLARIDLKAGVGRFHSAADHIAAAVANGYTQREAAKQLSMSAGSINRLLKWRTGGFVGTPFGPDNVAKRTRAFSQTKQEKVEKSKERARADEAKANAATAKADAAAAKAKAKADTATAKARASQARADAKAAHDRARAERERTKQQQRNFYRGMFSGEYGGGRHDGGPANLDESTRARFIKLLWMLHSDHDNERATAAKMVDDLRIKHNLSWEQLIVKATAFEMKEAA